MIEKDIFKRRAEIPHPLAAEFQIPEIVVVASGDAAIVAPGGVFTPKGIMMLHALSFGVPRGLIAESFISNFTRVWAEKLGSISPGDFFKEPCESDKCGVVDWSRPELAAWFEGEIPGPDTLAQRSLTYSEEILMGNLYPNIKEAEKSEPTRFSSLVDMALGVKLAASGPRWHEQAIAHGTGFAQDVIWTEARTSLTTHIDPISGRDRNPLEPQLNRFANDLARTQGIDEFDTYGQSIRVVMEKIGTELASPSVHFTYRQGLRPEDFTELKTELPHLKEILLALGWIESNLGDSEVAPQRVILPPSVDGFFVGLGAHMLLESYSSLSMGARSNARFLSDTNRRFLDI